MVAFYSTVFSFRLISDIPVLASTVAATIFSDTGYRVVRLQAPFGERLKLLAANEVSGEATGKTQQRASGNIIKAANTSFITFIVDDIATALQRALAHGATLAHDAAKIRPDLSIALLLDPEGNYLELAQYNDISQYRPDVQLNAKPEPS
ncbi:hypothetical protein GCM10011396_04650 [Undibacterium terreum]|uniref:VOC domain-containing protein n=2 Tax=Undibacterium terreum TaxID=1224302 RepID=A0A916U4W0_9BURK|nr:hypothetical protein GCM10011396_04650 [Undibacterium terreum]